MGLPLCAFQIRAPCISITYWANYWPEGGPESWMGTKSTS